MREISSGHAWQSVNETNRFSRWKSVVSRADSAVVLAQAAESPKLNLRDPIFCIGSCFARNIQEKLVARGFTVLSHQRFAPPSPTPFAPLPNIFNVRSLVNEFRWGLTDPGDQPEDAFVSDAQGLLYDPHSNVDKFRAPVEVVRQTRAGITANMKRLRDCQVVIMTLGLVEVWYDLKIGTYLNTTLPQFIMDREPERYVLRILDYQAVLDGLEECLALYQAHGKPGGQVFLSVSPVPLVATFSNDDVLIANNYSKSTQVAAAQDFASCHANVHYVPSFESVMTSGRRFSWETDLRHPTDMIVERVTNMFLKGQTGETGQSEPSAESGPKGDWPVVASELVIQTGVPKFASARAGDKDFPAGFPQVSASSLLAPAHNANALMSATKRIWHSQNPPQYPEWILFEFERALCLRRLFLQSQDKHPERAPSRFVLEIPVANGWQPVMTVDDTAWAYGGEWKEWSVSISATSSKFRLLILRNAGEPSLVTLQNAYLSPHA